ncbi:MAG: ribulose-phosphate 3-epimerase [Ignavibacteriae bacterium]|nr:ribulose-phosphate 3-epimerase [Ignavibacteriota bacterium]
MMKKLLCPSILSADFSNLYEDIKEVESAGADVIHCDIMDGHFVPNITFGPDVVKKINEITELPLDVHLMIDSPDKYIKSFCDSGADYISVHFENNIHLNRLINYIKSFNVKAGVAINPSTPVNSLSEIISDVDFILVMSVNPGFGGQKFIQNSIEKVKQLKTLLNQKNPNCIIEMDGGIGEDNIKMLSEIGVDMFVCGASIFKAKDKKEKTKELKNLINK